MDGLINVADIVENINNLLSFDYQYSEVGDVNEDGIVNVVDIVAQVAIILE